MERKQLKKILRGSFRSRKLLVAGWQSGHAAACKAVYAGSIPASASMPILITASQILFNENE